MNEESSLEQLSWNRVVPLYKAAWKEWSLWRAWVLWFLFFLLLALIGFASQGARRIVDSAAEGATSYAWTYLAAVLLYLGLMCGMFLKSEKASKFEVFHEGLARAVAVVGLGMVTFGVFRVVGSLLTSSVSCVSFASLLWLLFMPWFLVVAAIGTRILLPSVRIVGQGDRPVDSKPRIAAWILLIVSASSFFVIGDAYEIAGVKQYQAALQSLTCK